MLRTIVLLSIIFIWISPTLTYASGNINLSGYVQDSLGEEVRTFEFGADLYTGTHSNIEDLLSFNQKKYKGKTVILDLWGTFCRPCISDFKNSPAIKEELLKKNVHMVYLCAGKSSAPAKWTEIIQNLELKGDHVYLDRALTNGYMEKFEVRSYPSYIIMDKRGEFHKNIISGVGDIKVDTFVKRVKKL